jgi:hypothetical protein
LLTEDLIKEERDAMAQIILKWVGSLWRMHLVGRIEIRNGDYNLIPNRVVSNGVHCRKDGMESN